MRAILAVLAGYAAWTVLWLGLNAALQAALPGSFDENGATANAGLLVGLVVASGLVSVCAGWIAATIGRGGRAALVTALLLLATGIPVQIFYWSLLPVWYHLSFLVLLVPATLLGGALVKPAPTPALQ